MANSERGKELPKSRANTCPLLILNSQNFYRHYNNYLIPQNDVVILLFESLWRFGTFLQKGSNVSPF